MKINKRKRYRVSLTDESRLRRIAGVEMPLWQWILAGVAFAAVCVVIAGALLALTPLRKVMPGYVDEAQRQMHIESMLRLDSLQEQYDRNRAYIDNIMTVLDTEREPADSASIVVNPTPMTTDSLMQRTPEEAKFIKMMEQREKYNLSILAPLAAEGMMFNPVSDESVITEKTRHSALAEVVVASSSPIGSIADGIVVDMYYSRSDGGNAIIIQHGKGFVSRVSHLGNPLVGKGDYVQAGQIIAFPISGSGRDGSRVLLEIWRNGDALIPYDLLGR